MAGLPCIPHAGTDAERVRWEPDGNPQFMGGFLQKTAVFPQNSTGCAQSSPQACARASRRPGDRRVSRETRPCATLNIRGCHSTEATGGRPRTTNRQRGDGEAPMSRGTLVEATGVLSTGFHRRQPCLSTSRASRHGWMDRGSTHPFHVKPLRGRTSLLEALELRAQPGLDFDR